MVLKAFLNSPFPVWFGGCGLPLDRVNGHKCSPWNHCTPER